MITNQLWEEPELPLRILIALLVVIASPARAATITYLSDERYVATYYCLSAAWDGTFCDNGDFHYAPTIGESWSYSAGVARSMVSTLTPSSIALTFAVRAYTYSYDPTCDPNETNCISYSGPDDEVISLITFSVDEPTASIWTSEGVSTSINLVPSVIYHFDRQLSSPLGSPRTASYSMQLVPEPHPDLLCDVEMSQPSYQNGDPVVITSLRFSNSAPTRVTARLRLQLALPPPLDLVVDAIDLGADGSFEIPANFDNQLGPVTMFTLSPSTPLRGDFEWRCAFEDPATGAVIAEDRAGFLLR